MHNLTTATESLAKGTAEKPRILVHYLGGYAIKRLVLAGTPHQFAHCDKVKLSAAKALIRQGVQVHPEDKWVW